MNALVSLASAALLVLAAGCSTTSPGSGQASARKPALTNLVEQDVFVSGQDGYHTYRIPALVATPRGTLLAFCEGRKNSKSDTGDIDLLLKRSEDGGRTWSPQQVVWDDAGNTCGNPCPVVDARTGTIWLFATHNPGAVVESDIKARKAKGTRTVWVCSSVDDGRSWTRPRDVTATTKAEGWDWYATGPGVGIQIEHGPRAGRLVIPCDHSYRAPSAADGAPPAEFGSHAIYSDDRGRTWNIGGVIRPKLNECQVVEVAEPAGGLLMNMRSYYGRQCRAQSWSRDGGSTWTPPEDAPELVEPVCQASILRYSWPGQGEAGCILFSNPADGKKRVRMTVRLSRDDGRTWPVARELWSGFTAYSCLAVLPDRTVGCLYERGIKHSYEKITLARFPVGWLTAGAATP